MAERMENPMMVLWKYLNICDAGWFFERIRNIWPILDTKSSLNQNRKVAIYISIENFGLRDFDLNRKFSSMLSMFFSLISFTKIQVTFSIHQTVRKQVIWYGPASMLSVTLRLRWMVWFVIRSLLLRPDSCGSGYYCSNDILSNNNKKISLCHKMY